MGLYELKLSHCVEVCVLEVTATHTYLDTITFPNDDLAKFFFDFESLGVHQWEEETINSRKCDSLLKSRSTTGIWMFLNMTLKCKQIYCTFVNSSIYICNIFTAQVVIDAG